jgi:hypothetical protein
MFVIVLASLVIASKSISNVTLNQTFPTYELCDRTGKVWKARSNPVVQNDYVCLPLVGATYEPPEMMR